MGRYNTLHYKIQTRKLETKHTKQKKRITKNTKQLIRL